MDNKKKEVVVRLSPSVAKTQLQYPLCYDNDIDKYTIEDAVKYLLNDVPWKPDKRSLVNQLRKDMDGRKTLSTITHKEYETGSHKCTKICPFTPSVSLNESIGDYLSLAHSTKYNTKFYMLDLTLAKTQRGGEE